MEFSIRARMSGVILGPESGRHARRPFACPGDLGRRDYEEAFSNHDVSRVDVLRHLARVAHCSTRDLEYGASGLHLGAVWQADCVNNGVECKRNIGLDLVGRMTQLLFKVTHQFMLPNDRKAELLVADCAETAIAYTLASLDRMTPQGRRIVGVEELGPCFVCGSVPPAEPPVVEKVKASRAKKAAAKEGGQLYGGT